MTRSHFIIAALLLSFASGENFVLAQPELITEQGGVPALFEEVSASTADLVLQGERYLRAPYVDRVRILRVRSELLRREADVNELSALYLNLFPDLGLRIYIHGRIEREYGVAWLASPFPENNGRTFVNLIDTIGAHAYSGMRVEMNIDDPRFEGIGIAQINGTNFVAATERAQVARSDDPNRPELIVYQSSSVVLSQPSHSFFAEAGVRIDYSGLDAHFVSENTGYFIITGGLYHHNASRLYRTTDGGQNWIAINNALPGTPRRIHFSDHDTGYLTLSYQAGCQTTNDCPNATSLVMKTTDGGITWTGLDHPGSVGVPYIFDATGGDNLYGVFLRPPPSERRVLRISDDGATTWRDIYEFPAGEIVIRAEVVEGHVFVNFLSGELHRMNVSTGRGAAIVVPGYKVRDFRAPSPDTVFAQVDGAAGRQLLMTTDRGASWAPVPLESWFEFIAAPSEDELVLIVNKGSYGPSDTSTTTDVIAYSRDAGATWEETPSIGGLITRNKRAQSVNGRVHKVLLSDRVLTVRTTPVD